MDIDRDDAKEGVALTPGGPRPSGSVHPVRPGQRLRQLDDGSFVVEPDPCRTESEIVKEDEVT